MRLLAIFPALLSFIALILSFLCIFAGSKTGFMETHDILTLNTSRIAVDVFTNNSPSPGSNKGNGGFLSGITHHITHEVHHLTAAGEHEIESALNNALASFAATIGLHDFYSVHVLDFCEGFFSPSNSSHKNVTHCSSTQGLFTFRPGAVLQRELNAAGLDITLADLHWPRALDDAVAALALAFDIVFVLFCVGAGAAGVAVWTGATGVVMQGRTVMLVNLAVTQLGFFALFVAAAVVTGAASKATNVVNEYGKEIDVNATRGDKLITLAWTAVVLMFLAGVYWMVECCVLRRRAKKEKISKEEQ